MYPYRPDFNKILEAKTASEFRALIEAGFPIDGRDIEGNTILFLTDSVEIAQTAIELGLDLEARDIYGLTAICNQTNDDVIRCLIEAGANVNPKLKHSRNGSLGQNNLSPTSFKRLLDAGAKPAPHLLHDVLDDIQKVKLLLATGVDINDDEEGFIPLNNANDPAIMRLLLEAGADAKHIVDGETCFWTCHYDSDECLMMLLKAGADPIHPGPNERTTLMLAQSPQVIRALIDAGVAPLAISKNGETALMHDMEPEALQILLDAGVDPHAVDHHGKNALFYINNADTLRLLIQMGVDIHLHDTMGNDEKYISSDRAGSTPLFHVTNSKAAKVLIEAGADVNARNCDGRTPLFYAPDIDIVQLFIEAGADVTIRDRFGYVAPMEYLYENECACVEVLKAMIDAGLDPFFQTEHGLTLLHFAPNAAIARYLIELGLDVNAKDHDGTTPIISTAEYDDVVQVLIEAGADVNAQDSYGFTALMIAADHINEASVKQLIQAGADVNATRRCKTRWSVIMTAIYASSPRIIEMLVKAGADIEQRVYDQYIDKQGTKTTIPSQTPLMYSDYYPEAALALIALGADVNARDANHRTPLMYLRENDNVIIALIEAGADTHAVDDEGHDVPYYIGEIYTNPEEHLKEWIEEAKRSSMVCLKENL